MFLSSTDLAREAGPAGRVRVSKVQLAVAAYTQLVYPLR